MANDISSTDLLTGVGQRRRISYLISRVPFSTKLFDDWTSGVVVLEQEWKELCAFVNQFRAFENCLLGLAGNTYATAIVDVRRLLHLQLQNATQDEFPSQIIPHPSPPKTLNAQQHNQVCSIVTSYRLIDIIARVSGLPSNGFKVDRGLYQVENKEPEGYVKHLRDWPALCFKVQNIFNAITLNTESPTTVSGGHQLLGYIAEHATTSHRSKIICNLLVAASHLAFIAETQFHPNTLPDLPNFINDERIKASRTTNERDFLVGLRKLIQDYDLRPEESSSGLSLASFRAALHLAVNISPLYLLTPYTIAKRQWSRQTINQVGAYLGSDKPAILVEVENVIWRAIFFMSIGKMSPTGAVSFIKDNVDWESLRAQSSQGLVDGLDFFDIRSKASERGTSHGSVDALRTQDSVEHPGNHLNTNAPMNEDAQVDGTGANSEGGGSRGPNSVANAGNLNFGVEQHIEPVPMDEDERVDGAGANSEGGGSRGPNSVANAGNLNFGVEQHIEPVPMDEDERVDGAGPNSEGGVSRGPDSVPNADNLNFGVEQHGEPAPMDEDERVDGVGPNVEGGVFRDPDSVANAGDLTSGLKQHVEPVPMNEDERVNGAGPNIEGNVSRGPESVANAGNLTSGLEQHVEPVPMNEDERVNGTGPNIEGDVSRGPESVANAGNLTSGLEQHVEPVPMNEDERVNGAGPNIEGDVSRGPESVANAGNLTSGVEQLNVGGSESEFDKTEGRRQSSRLQGRSDHQASDKCTDGTSKSKPKPWRGRPRPKPRPQPRPKPKPELEKPLGNLDNFGTHSNPINVDFLQQGSLWDPDGLDAYRLKKDRTIPQCSLIEIPGNRAKCKGEFYAFTASGEKVRLEPNFHYESYAIRFSELMGNVQKQYDKDVPPHRQEGGHSVIQAMTWDEYNQKKPEELQKILLTKNIVVSGHLEPTAASDLKFDENGLEEIFSIHDPISLQDFSQNEDRSDDDKEEDEDEDLLLDEFDKMTMHLPKTVEGTLQDVLANSESTRGMTLNALDLPLSSSEYSSSKSFSSDKTAYHFTKSSNSFSLHDPYPFEDLNWGLIGTKNVITFIHIDSDGLGTHVLIRCGCKVWFFLRPKQDPSSQLSSRYMFLDQAFRLDRVLDSAQYDLEAVALTPGDLLIMQPRQPHAVYGHENTVCIGGHFILTHLMEFTAQGLLHAFVLNEFITNTYHYPSRALFRRILDFCKKGLLEGKVKRNSSAYSHIPDLGTFDGLINLLSLCNLVILGNVLDFRTYLAPNQPPERHATLPEQEVLENYDRNKIPKQERVAMMFYRGLAFEVIEWIKSHFDFWNPKGETVDLPSHYLTQQLLALSEYKSDAANNKKGHSGAPHCTPDLLQKQITNVIQCNKALEKYWSLFRNQVNTSQLGFGDRSGWKFERRQTFLAYVLRTEDELIDDGTTELDQRFKDSDKSLQTRINNSTAQADHHGGSRKRARLGSLS